MNQINIQTYNSKFGELIIGSYQNSICLCDWKYRKMRESIDSRIQKVLNAKYVQQNCPIIAETIQQLSEYSAGQRKSFDIPLTLAGTDFQKSVWQQLMKIPYGITLSYLGLAKRMEAEKSIRAIASANGANAISIIVPCHRIIGSKGEMVGYAGGTSTKHKLLELESRLSNNQQTKLFA